MAQFMKKDHHAQYEDECQDCYNQLFPLALNDIHGHVDHIQINLKYSRFILQLKPIHQRIVHVFIAIPYANYSIGS